MVSKQIRDYISAAKDTLGLSHWEVTVSEDPAPDDAWADVEVSTNLYQATIRLSPNFLKQKDTEIRRVVAHELIHLHQAGVERLVEALEKPLGSAAYEILSYTWDIESERAADSLSTVLAGVLPLPKFGEK